MADNFAPLDYLSTARSELDICNLALIKVGAEPITTFNVSDVGGDALKRTKMCLFLYEPTRYNLLGQYPWSFAMKNTNLDADLEERENGDLDFPYRFLIPNDCFLLRDVRVEKYTRRGQYIYANESVINITYVFDEKNVLNFPPLFVNCFASLLACGLSNALTSNASLKQLLMAEYEEEYMKATGMDSTQSSPEKIGSSNQYR